MLSRSARQQTEFVKITPDGTAPSDWYCIYSNNIARDRFGKDTVIMGFAWAQLSDQYPVNPSRLGGYFCRPDNIQGLADTALIEHDNLLAFFAGTASRLYLNREAIRNRLLDFVIPNYQVITQQLNKPPEQESTGGAGQDRSTAYTYETLKRLSQHIQTRGGTLILVAMPVQHGYALDPGLIETIRQEQITMIDMRSLAEGRTGLFEDSIHLNSTGQKVFSNQLAEALFQHIPR